MYSIEQLIPQRWPMLLVDSVISADEESCVTSYIVKRDSVLFYNGKLMSGGVVENMAQSASAWAGYNAIKEGAQQVPVGFIGEVRKFQMEEIPCQGQQLRTHISRKLTFGDVSTVSAKTFIDDKEVASCTMKIVLQK